MSLDRVQKTWEKLGRDDPLWAILTDPARRHGRWDPEEFFATGVAEVADWVEQTRAIVPELGTGSALDFGCGVGRLTQALADHFDRVVGVDIAEPMIEQAHRFNRHGERCRYLVNTTGDLSVFPDGGFDFVLTVIVLQHMPPDIAFGYLGEFLRILRPGGVLVFQLPRGTNDHVVDRSLPDSAFRASISARVPADVRPGARLEVEADVTNTSDHDWSPDLGNYALRLGNHWRSADGQMLRLDDGRAFLTELVRPGETVRLRLECHAPTTAGSYLFDLDMVQDGVDWFANKGSTVWSAPVRVKLPSWFARRRAANAPAAAAEEEELMMEMYTTPDPVITELLERQGGKVVATRFWSREAYDDAAYWVRKG